MKTYILTLLLLMVSSMAANAQQINAMTRAILNGYTEAIKENPNDYLSLYDRSAQYFRLSMYDDALNDIIKAITVTPEKETQMLAAEYSLLGDIQIELKEYAKALTATQKAVELNPDSYADIYKKGNVALALNLPEEAWKAFNQLQRFKSRSQEAYFGMAKADIMLGKSDEAFKLIKQARDADPNSSITFCRTGDLYRDLGDDQAAAADYLSAFALSDGDSRAMESLIKLGKTNYPAVQSALNYALSKTDNPLPLNFLKANIAYLTGNFADALEGFDDLLDNPQAREASIYLQAAKTALALNNADKGLEYINAAILRKPASDSYAIQSRLYGIKGMKEQAFGAATKAKAANPGNIEALLALADSRMALEDYEEAVEVLNEVLLNDASCSEALMRRAYLYNNKLDKSKLAVVDYQRVANADETQFPDVAYKAMAKSLNGKKLDGDAIIERALLRNSGKDAKYWAAVYYCQTGSLEKAMQQLLEARNAGYSNQYNLISNNIANLNIEPLRKLMK